MPHVGLDEPADVGSPYPLDDRCGCSARVKLAECAGMRKLFQSLLFRANGLQMARDAQCRRRGYVQRGGSMSRIERHVPGLVPIARSSIFERARLLRDI